MYPVALLALAFVAQVPAPTPVSAEPYKLVDLAPPAAVEGAAYLWDVVPEDVADVRELPGGRLILTGPPGRYALKLRAVTMAEGKLAVQTTRYVVTINGAVAPPPRPPDKPPAVPEGRLDPMRARVRLSVPAEGGRSYGCSGTVIRPRQPGGKWQMLSAAHCIPGGKTEGTIRTTDDRSFRVRLLVADRRADIAWFEILEPPADLWYADLAREVPAVGTPIWHAGYGVDRPGNTERGTIRRGERADGMIEMDISTSSGDSGTGFFHDKNGQVVAVLYGVQWEGRGPVSIGGCCRRAWEIRPE